VEFNGVRLTSTIQLMTDNDDREVCPDSRSNKNDLREACSYNSDGDEGNERVRWTEKPRRRRKANAES